MNILAEGIGIVGLVIVVISLQQKDRSRVLVLQIFSNLCYAIQMLLYGSLSSSVLLIINLFRNIAFYYRDRISIRHKFLIPLFFCVLMLIDIIINYEGIMSILLFIVCVLYTYGIWGDDMPFFRKTALVNQIVWTANSFYHGAIMSGISVICELISTSVAIYRYDIRKK